MESRRFDTFARAFARGSSRRGMLRGAALASTAALVPAVARADGGVTTSVGGASTPCVCPTSERPARQVTATPPFPSLIVEGSCDKYDTTNAIDLKTVGNSAKPTGQSGVVAIIASQTPISTSLAELVSKSRAVVVQASATDTTPVACGNLGSEAGSGALSIGVKEQNGSTYSGIVTFTPSASGTEVSLLVGRGLFETVTSTTSGEFPVGSYVIANTDLNLRATPDDNGSVVAILGQGSELQVTGAAQGKWLPVDDIASGDSGYVNSQYVTAE